MPYSITKSPSATVITDKIWATALQEIENALNAYDGGNVSNATIPLAALVTQYARWTAFFTVNITANVTFKFQMPAHAVILTSIHVYTQTLSAGATDFSLIVAESGVNIMAAAKDFDDTNDLTQTALTLTDTAIAAGATLDFTVSSVAGTPGLVAISINGLMALQAS